MLCDWCFRYLDLILGERQRIRRCASASASASVCVCVCMCVLRLSNPSHPSPPSYHTTVGREKRISAMYCIQINIHLHLHLHLHNDESSAALKLNTANIKSRHSRKTSITTTSTRFKVSEVKKLINFTNGISNSGRHR